MLFGCCENVGTDKNWSLRFSLKLGKVRTFTSVGVGLCELVEIPDNRYAKDSKFELVSLNFSGLLI